jgi:Type I restriction enzyme R protein N terminus (HSDR_N)
MPPGESAKARDRYLPPLLVAGKAKNSITQQPRSVISLHLNIDNQPSTSRTAGGGTGAAARSLLEPSHDSTAFDGLRPEKLVEVCQLDSPSAGWHLTCQPMAAVTVPFCCFQLSWTGRLMAISKKSTERAISGLKRLLPVIQQQKARDVSEADTAALVREIMADVFGFDKFTDLVSEHAIRGTYCDLAVHIDDKIVELVEIKSAGTTLDDRHVKQAIDYGANKGIAWVVLTNASVWRLYEVVFGKPIDKRLLSEVDLTTLNLKQDDCVDCLAPFMKEGFLKGVQEEFRDRQDATSRYLLSALILHNDRVVRMIRRELKKVVDVLVAEDEILKVLRDDVIKRETTDGPQAEAALKKVNKKLRPKMPCEALAGENAGAAPGGAIDSANNGKLSENDLKAAKG